MTIELYDRLKAGGSNITWIFHVGGFPYALASDQKIIDALESDTTNRRIMFGKAHDGADYPADDIPIFNALQGDSLGSQTISICEEKGEFQGGDWSVNIARVESGYAWTHRDGDIWGFEGIHTQPSLDFDDTVCSVTLYDNLGTGTGAILDVTADIGDRLITKIDALGADDYVYLWIGSECIAVNDYSVNGKVITLTVVTRGVYRTPIQSYYLAEKDHAEIKVTNAPLNGISNRPVYLWAVPMSNNGTEISGSPVLFRQGFARPRVTSKDGITKINCAPWWDWLKTTTKPLIKGTLSGYTFNRVWNTDKQIELRKRDRQPAMVIWEIKNIGVKDKWNDPKYIFLCPEGAADGDVTKIREETWEELRQALNKELSACYGIAGKTPVNGSDGLSFQYAISPTGKTKLFGADKENWACCTGYLPWLLNIGYMQNRDRELELNTSKRNWQWFTSWNYSQTEKSGLTESPEIDDLPRTIRLIPHQRSFSDMTEGFFVPDAKEAEQMVAQYAYQYGWEVENSSEFSATKTALNRWTVPQDPTAGTRLLFLNLGETSVKRFSDESRLQVGSDNYTFQYKESMEARPTLHRGGIHTIGAGTTPETNYFRINSDYFYKFGAETFSALATFDDEKLPLRQGDFLTYIPYFHGKEDPWTVSPINKLIAVNSTIHPIVQIFRGLFGATTNNAFCAERYKILHIPGIITDSGGNQDFQSVFDWDQLNSLLNEISQEISLQSELTLSPGTDIYKLFINELKLYGITMTHYYKHNIKQFNIGFRRTGILNSTEAFLTKQIINISNRELYKAPRTEIHSGERLVSGFKIQINWDNKEEKYKLDRVITDETGDLLTRFKGEEVKIESKISSTNGIQDESNLITYFKTLLQKLAIPQPEIDLDLSIDVATKLGVGNSTIIITDSTAYNPFTGKLGLTDITALVIKLTTDLSKQKTKATFRLNPNKSYGWAPSLSVPNSTHSENSATELEVQLTDDEKHVFSDGDNRIDLSYFDCFNWNKSTNVYEARNCSCGNYVVYMFEKNVNNPTIWPLTLSFSSENTLTEGHADYQKFILTGAHAGYNAAKDYIVEFPKWNEEDIQLCQKMFIHNANDNHVLIDFNGDKNDGRKWG